MAVILPTRPAISLSAPGRPIWTHLPPVSPGPPTTTTCPAPPKHVGGADLRDVGPAADPEASRRNSIEKGFRRRSHPVTDQPLREARGGGLRASCASWLSWRFRRSDKIRTVVSRERHSCFASIR